jgi:hypothetical protein
MAGYSKRILIEKLGIKAGSKIIFLNTPENYPDLLGKLPPNTIVLEKLEEQLDFIHLFATEKRELENIFSKIKRALSETGMLWVSWPKRASKVETDLTEDVVREVGIENNLVDVKVCAIDEIWSGLKFVYRVKDRKK